MFMTTTQTSDQTKPAELMRFIPAKDAPFTHSWATIAFGGEQLWLNRRVVLNEGVASPEVKEKREKGKQSGSGTRKLT